MLTIMIRVMVAVVSALGLIIISLTLAYAADVVDMGVIKQIESGGNAAAYNRYSGARGAYQITDVVRREYNTFHNSKYQPDDLFNVEINYLIASWYLNKRIPQMLKHYHKAITINNILIAYNAGISYVVSGKKLPSETINYIKRYQARAK